MYYRLIWRDGAVIAAPIRPYDYSDIPVARYLGTRKFTDEAEGDKFAEFLNTLPDCLRNWATLHMLASAFAEPED